MHAVIKRLLTTTELAPTVMVCLNLQSCHDQKHGATALGSLLSRNSVTYDESWIKA